MRIEAGGEAIKVPLRLWSFIGKWAARVDRDGARDPLMRVAGSRSGHSRRGKARRDRGRDPDPEAPQS